MAGLAAALVVFLGALSALLVVRWAADALTGAPPSAAPEEVPFAGGKPPRVHAWSRYHVRYYAMALLFLAFDMEMVFMYPWAVVFVREGMLALLEMLMFILILALGVLYGWRERAFEWA